MKTYQKLIGMLLLFCNVLAAQDFGNRILNIQFGGDGSAVRTGPAAVGVSPSDFWNRYSRDGQGGWLTYGVLQNLRWADSSPADGTLIIENAPGLWGNGHPDPMFGSYLYPFNTNEITVTFTNLSPGIYSVLVYAHGGPPNEQNARITLRTGSQEFEPRRTSTGATWQSVNWKEGAQFVRFTNVVVVTATGPLVIQSHPDGASQAFINGIQLVREQVIANPTLINVQFGTDQSPPRTGQAAIGVSSNDFWNLYSRDDGRGGYRMVGGVTNLSWTDRSSSGARLTISNAPGAWGNGFPDAMFGGYLYPLGPGNIEVEIGALPGGTYEFLVYAHGGPPNQHNSVVELFSMGESYGTESTSAGPDWSLPEWQEGRQFVRFDRVAVPPGSTQRIVISPGGVATINGLQIRKVSSQWELSPELDIFPQGSGLFTNSVEVSIAGRTYGSVIRYSMDGTSPNSRSPIYSSRIRLTASTIVQAQGFRGENPVGPLVSKAFTRVFIFNDGIPNEWRIRYFGTNYWSDPRALQEADPDSDGASNAQEFLTGGDPLNPLSGFATQIRLIPSVSWHSVPGIRYEIFRKQSSLEASWTLISEVTASGTNSRYLDETTTNSKSFYTVRPRP